MSQLFNMSDLRETLGVTITSPFITETLGIEPDEKDKRSSKYRHETVVRVIDALIEHLTRVRDSENFVHAEKAEKPAKAAPAPAAAAEDEGEDW